MKTPIIRFIVLVCLGFILGAIFAFVQMRDAVAPQAQGAKPAAITTGTPIGGAFSLTDQEGNDVTNESWPGAYKLVFFGFTNCPDICPAGLQKIAAALEILGADANNIQPLLITVDPERDTPDVLAEYTTLFDSRITGLTGTREQIDAVISSYKVYAAKSEPADAGHGAHAGHGTSYSVNHSGYMYLMSPDDQLLEIFKTEEEAEVMAVKISAHLQD